MKKDKKNKLVSIIVPCFNEEEALPLFYDEITKVFKKIKQDYELILVNDGSKDKTLDVMKQLAKDDNHIVYLSFSRNFGKESAMYAGLCNAKGEYVGFIDADLQHPPILLKKMIDVLDKTEYVCSACKRINRDGDSFIRTCFTKEFYGIINKISDVRMEDGAGDFRLMKREMVDAIISMPEYNRFSKGIFGWVGFNTFWIEYDNVERVAGTTSWSFWGLVKYAISGIINFSQFPLDISTYLGVFTGIISLIYFIIILINKTPVNSNSFIIFLILFISAIQLVCIGILGQYIGKTYTETKKRPHFIISDTNKKDSIKIG